MPSLRIACVSVWTTLAVFTAACGQADISPTSPSRAGGTARGGAVISGTVSGMAFSSPLTAQVTTQVTKPVTVSVVGTSISTTIDGSGRFQLTGVPAGGDVQLKFVGDGLDATLTLRDVQAGDRIEIKVRLTETSVRIEAERRDRRGDNDDDDDDDDDEDDDEDDDDNETEGLVSGLSGTCPNITFTIKGIAVKANNTTRFDDGTCAQVKNNVKVEVHGPRQSDGSIQATRIEIDD